MAKIVFVIAPENFRDEELFHTKEELEKAGHETMIASAKKGLIKGNRGGSAEAIMLLEEINADDFSAIVFVGGRGAAQYFENDTALNLAKEFYRAGKIVAAICIAPSILANAGILADKKATSFPSEKENLEAKGAKYTAQPIEVSGRIVTAIGPEAAREFGKTIAGLLK